MYDTKQFLLDPSSTIQPENGSLLQPISLGLKNTYGTISKPKPKPKRKWTRLSIHELYATWIPNWFTAPKLSLITQPNLLTRFDWFWYFWPFWVFSSWFDSFKSYCTPSFMQNFNKAPIVWNNRQKFFEIGESFFFFDKEIGESSSREFETIFDIGTNNYF